MALKTGISTSGILKNAKFRNKKAGIHLNTLHIQRCMPASQPKST